MGARRGPIAPIGSSVVAASCRQLITAADTAGTTLPSGTGTDDQAALGDGHLLRRQGRREPIATHTLPGTTLDPRRHTPTARRARRVGSAARDLASRGAAPARCRPRCRRLGRLCRRLRLTVGVGRAFSLAAPSPDAAQAPGTAHRKPGLLVATPAARRARPSEAVAAEPVTVAACAKVG